MTENQPKEQPKAKEEPKEEPKATSSDRFAAFDKTLGKYVGGVRDTKGEADDIAKGIRDAGRKAEVRKV